MRGYTEDTQTVKTESTANIIPTVNLMANILIKLQFLIGSWSVIHLKDSFRLRASCIRACDYLLQVFKN